MKLLCTFVPSNETTTTTKNTIIYTSTAEDYFKMLEESKGMSLLCIYITNPNSPLAR